MNCSQDSVEEFIRACIDDPQAAASLVRRSPALLTASYAGDPIVHWLIAEDYAEAVSGLLRLGVAVDVPNEAGRTPLGHAASLGRLGCARILLASGADANASDPFMCNVLHAALVGGNTDVAVLLIRNGARADYVGPCYETVLRGIARLVPEMRAIMMEILSEQGITRNGLFESKKLGEVFSGPEEAYGW